MDRAYLLAQTESWHRMSEPAQHRYLLREQPGHYDRCSTCQTYLNPDGSPKPKADA